MEPNPSALQVRYDENEVVDIEHVSVRDDPRKWSATRKRLTLAAVASAALITPLAGSIYNPAIRQIQAELDANNAEIALSISLFVIIQGSAPLVWSAISEIKGRKVVYLSSIAIFTGASAAVGVSKTIEVLIGMRVLQGAGNAAVLAIGAGTLADIFDSHERGTMLGIYYAAPLLGPSLGPILGGVLTQVWSWRATFYFLSAFGGVLLVMFLIFKDTFRRERSLCYQTSLNRMRRRTAERKKTRSGAGEETAPERREDPVGNIQLEERAVKEQHAPNVEEIKLSLSDLNPFPPLWQVLTRKNNVTVFVVSGLIFGYTYSIGYTGALTLSNQQYDYDALHVGLILLSFGLGSIGGSIFGGRWSDRVLRKKKSQLNGPQSPEARLVATLPCMPLLPLSVFAYGWMAEKHVHISGLVVSLTLSGFSLTWLYSITLAYIVDANKGRSSTAVAGNSLFRGLGAFIASEAAVPLQLSIGDGGTYTLWGVLCIAMDVMILVVIWRGAQWRQKAEEKEDRINRREECISQ